MNTRNAVRFGAAGLGAALLAAAGAAVALADTEYGTGDVDVTVEIEEIEVPGTLALTVAGTSAPLTENGSTELVRQFTGALPAVTVTDTRAAADVPTNAAWYVLGSSTDFTDDAGIAAPIPAENLGWEPQIVGDDSGGLVFAGEPVESDVDGGAGLVDQELLVSTFDSAGVLEDGSWSAIANLALRTPADVTPGSYTATITLSLFE
mgnify:CR=1 FL=1